MIDPADTRLPHNNEAALLEQGRRIRALHEIISRPDLSFDEQIDATLRLGCAFLGTEIGKVGRQDPAHNVSEFLNTITLTNLPIKRGIIFPLDKTFCQVTFASPETIAISHVAQSEFKNTPAAQFLGIQSYIGTSINVYGKKFGTVNFSNRTPVQRAFTEADKDFVKLIGSWISVMMERQLEAEELKKSKEAAEAANQAKSAFLANMSHEIRTPLTSIIGFSDTALDEDQTVAQRVESLRIIRSSSEHLLHLINNILDFSKIEAGELEIDKTACHPVKLLAEVEAIMTAQARKKQLAFGVQYLFPLPGQFSTDPLRLKQILLNLCSNAIKFTDRGAVQLVVHYDQPQNELKFSIKDSGIGMTPEQISQLFKPFKQADASISRRYGGTGLGLSLSQRLAVLLNGKIEVTSTPGEGSVFELTLHQVTAAASPVNLLTSLTEPVCQGATATRGGTMPKLSGAILLAEDNDINQQIIRRFLEIMGATVTVVDNGASAITQAQQHDYDLIYMDMQMPEVSGIDAVKQLRANAYAKPIVMLTANATQEDRALCKQVGCNDFMTKPIDRQQLYAVTATYLKKAPPGKP